jgi:plasmid maintenance system antidote protein VapI
MGPVPPGEILNEEFLKFLGLTAYVLVDEILAGEMRKAS